jgi:anaerobic ribonucleoside-triphosphate reductase
MAGALHKVFTHFYEYLQFKRNPAFTQAVDLYGTLFAKVDPQGTKMFNRAQIHDLLEDKLGMQKDLAQQEVAQFFQQYNPKSGFIKYPDIEKDYQAFVQEESKAGKLPKVTTLHEILKMIRMYVEVQSISLRQAFGKTKVGETDVIHQYQFTKIMSTIVAQAAKNGLFHQHELDDTSLSLFINEVSTRTQSTEGTGIDPLKATMKQMGSKAGDNSKQVSFTEL